MNDKLIYEIGKIAGISTITNGIVTIIGTLIFMFALNIPLAIVITIVTYTVCFVNIKCLYRRVSVLFWLTKK